MYGILVAIAVLAVLIFVHELGHFLAAKLCGVGVERFSIGFGTKLWGIKRGETEYVISLVPLGGYVKLLGENPEEEVDKCALHRSFSGKPLSIRTLVVAAGPIFNILFSVFILAIVYVWGIPILESVVGEVLSHTPAASAGLEKGDRIVEIEGKKIDSWDELSKVILANPGTPLRLVLERKGNKLVVLITPQPYEKKNIFGEKKIVGKIGIVAAGNYHVKKSNPAKALLIGIQGVANMVYLTIVGIIKLLQRVIPAKSVGGPILIMQMATQQAKAGLINLFYFMAFISVNLGVINLFPIPILDGGHLLFFTIEGIRGKPVSTRIREMAQQIGLAIIIAIMVLAFYNDLTRLLGSKR